MSEKEASLTAEEVRQFLDYDAESGRFLWRSKSAPSSRVKVGDVAGSTCKFRGYRTVRLKGRAWREHRLVWLWHHGSWPTEQVDHINGDRADNRIENLREADLCQQRWNIGVPKNSTTGVRGVSYSSRHNKYIAAVKYRGRCVYLGLFKTIAEAAEVCRAAQEKHFGEFARKEKRHEQRV